MVEKREVEVVNGMEAIYSDADWAVAVGGDGGYRVTRRGKPRGVSVTLAVWDEVPDV